MPGSIVPRAFLCLCFRSSEFSGSEFLRQPGIGRRTGLRASFELIFCRMPSIPSTIRLLDIGWCSRIIRKLSRWTGTLMEVCRGSCFMWPVSLVFILGIGAPVQYFMSFISRMSSHRCSTAGPKTPIFSRMKGAIGIWSTPGPCTWPSFTF